MAARGCGHIIDRSELTDCMVRNVKSLPDGRVKARRNFFIGFGRFEPSSPLVHKLRAGGVADAYGCTCPE